MVIEKVKIISFFAKMVIPYKIRKKKKRKSFLRASKNLHILVGAHDLRPL